MLQFIAQVQLPGASVLVAVSVSGSTHFTKWLHGPVRSWLTGSVSRFLLLMWVLSVPVCFVNDIPNHWAMNSGPCGLRCCRSPRIPFLFGFLVPRISLNVVPFVHFDPGLCVRLTVWFLCHWFRFSCLFTFLASFLLFLRRPLCEWDST